MVNSQQTNPKLQSISEMLWNATKASGKGFAVGGLTLTSLPFIAITKLISEQIKEIGEDTGLDDAIPYITNAGSIFMDLIDPAGAERRQQKRIERDKVRNAQNEVKGFSLRDLLDPSRREKRDNRARVAMAKQTPNTASTGNNVPPNRTQVNTARIADMIESLITNTIQNVNVELKNKTGNIASTIDAMVKTTIIKSADNNLKVDPATEKYNNVEKILNNSQIITDKSTQFKNLVNNSEIVLKDNSKESSANTNTFDKSYIENNNTLNDTLNDTLDKSSNEKISIIKSDVVKIEEKENDILEQILDTLKQHTIFLQTLAGNDDKFAKIEAFRESKDQVNATADTIEMGQLAAIKNVPDEERIKEAGGGDNNNSNTLSFLEMILGGSVLTYLTAKFPMLGKVLSKIPLVGKYLPIASETASAIGTGAGALAAGSTALSKGTQALNTGSKMAKALTFAGKGLGWLSVPLFATDAYLNATPENAAKLYDDPTMTGSAGVSTAIGNYIGGVPDYLASLFGYDPQISEKITQTDAFIAKHVDDAVKTIGESIGAVIWPVENTPPSDFKPKKNMLGMTMPYWLAPNSEETNSTENNSEIKNNTENSIVQNQSNVAQPSNSTVQNRIDNSYWNEFEFRSDNGATVYPIIPKSDRIFTNPLTENVINNMTDIVNSPIPMLSTSSTNSTLQRIEKSVENSMQSDVSTVAKQPVIIRGGDTINNYNGSSAAINNTPVRPDHVKPPQGFEYWNGGGRIPYLP